MPSTAARLDRQERCFTLSVVDGKSVRKIAEEVGIDKNTVVRDIRAEESRRAGEIADRRQTELARSVAVYEDVKRRALETGKLDALIDAQTRIDKLLGLEASVKVTVNPAIENLLMALDLSE